LHRTRLRRGCGVLRRLLQQRARVHAQHQSDDDDHDRADASTRQPDAAERNAALILDVLAAPLVFPSHGVVLMSVSRCGAALDRQ
jgi:hypothetical protein